MKEEQRLNEPQKPKLDIFGVIHSFLDKTKYRMMLLLPPLIVWLITATYMAIAKLYFGLSVSSFIYILHLISVGMLMIGTIVLIWNDNKRRKNNCV
jgi:hypothetical protein